MKLNRAMIVAGCVPLILAGLSACQPRPTPPAELPPGGGAACTGTIAFNVPKENSCYSIYGATASIIGSGPTWQACYDSQTQLRNALFLKCGTLTQASNNACVCRNGTINNNPAL
jgi:hypothetical protein